MKKKLVSWIVFKLKTSALGDTVNEMKRQGGENIFSKHLSEK